MEVSFCSTLTVGLVVLLLHSAMGLDGELIIQKRSLSRNKIMDSMYRKYKHKHKHLPTILKRS